MILGFWGLTVFPEKTYTQVVDNSFKLSMAALDENVKGGRTSLRVTVDKKTFILCSLTVGKHEQQNLDLVFTEGEEITFSVSGDNTVHLSGNYLPEDEGMDFDDEDDMEDDEDDMPLARGAKRVAQFDGEDDEDDEDSEEDPDFASGDDDEDDDEEEDDEDEEEEVVVPVKKVKAAAAAPAPKKAAETAPAAKKQKAAEGAAVPVKAEAKKPEAKKPEVKKPEAKKPEVKKEEPKKEDNKKVLPNGLIIEDVKVGDGARAKSGKKIGMRYIGRLTNGKVFDKNTSGKPFNFNLGRGEVIKGWDLGIQGMQLGGERRLTIPPALAYGSQGAPPDIPRNATLVFEVKLVTLK